MTEKEFRILCLNHDHYYQFTDSRKKFLIGKASYEKIKQAVIELGLETAIPIWNDVIIKKYKNNSAKVFLWKIK